MYQRIFRPFGIVLILLGLTLGNKGYGQALFLNGGASYASCGDLDVTGSQITVEAIVMSVGASVNIVSKHTGPGNVNYLLRPGGVEITTSNGYISAPANFSPTVNECYHVAFTYDGANLNYYVNGCLASTVAHTGTLVTNDFATAIGNQSNCQCEAWNGYIDEVRIWNVARTEAQIQANMFDLPTPGSQAGLLAYYKFDGDYVNAQGNATWDAVPVGSPQLQVNNTCDNADFTFSSSATVTDVTCPGGNDGTVTLSSTGGFNSYYYSLDGITYTPTNTVNGLPAGNVNVLARSGLGSCIVPVPVTIIQPAPFDVNVTGTDPTCYGGTDGTANLSVTGGTMPYTMQWSNGSTWVNPIDLPGGTNTVTITDVNGCTATGSVDLGEPDPVAPTAYAGFVSNTGMCDATGVSNPQGGTPPYTYNWSTGGTSATDNNLCEGPNTVTVTDANGCIGQQTINVSVPACLTDVDFNAWQQVGNPANGNWIVQAGGAELRQTVNGNPTFFITQDDYINVRMRGRMRTTDGDDDFIGVVFGHKEPLGNSTQYDTWLFDWKQRSQGSGGFTGQEGFTLSRILGNIPNNGGALSPTFWGHTNTAEFTVIDTDYGAGKGYVRNQFHDIEVLYTTTRTVILVDNDTIFDIEDCFEPGRFGFYNYSQPQVYYTDFTYELFVSFNFEEDRVCVNDTAHMVFFEPCGANTELDQFDEMYWDFGDNTQWANTNITVDNVNPSHVYNNPGTYTVRLIALDNLGCRDTIYRNIEIVPLPSADFTFTDQCFQDLTQFTETSTVGNYPITSWEWNFNDNATSALEDPTHTFSAAGVYNVSLIAADDYGCADTITKPVEIYALPEPAFAFLPVCDGEPMDLLDVTNDATGIATTDWDLGDGNTANTSLVSHTYASDGTYNVTLDVVSNVGCIAQITQPVTVFPVPVADFTFAQVCAGQVTQLTDASTVAAPSSIDSWLWDIGFTGTVDYQTQNAQHTFNTGGSYDVVLTAVSDFGCEHSVTIPVVSDPIPATNASATEACLGQPNDFTDLSTIATGTVDSWAWDFGDQTGTSTLQNPSYTYGNSGVYTVTLTATSDLGCSEVFTFDAIVHELPVPDFAPIDDCYSPDYPFTDASTIVQGAVTGWQWDFGDAGTASTQNPTHTYATFGSYDVKLIVTSAAGCVDSITQSIILHDNPIAGFEVPPVCQEEPVAIQDTSSIQEGNIVGWAYTFGGGGSSTDQNPTHAFLTSGSVNVTQTVTSNFGCTGTTTVAVTVHPKPEAAFSAPDVCLNVETVFTDQTTVASGTVDIWEWDLGDSNTETQQNFTHTYDPAGVYDITVMVETDQGCRDTLTQQTEVYQLPTADFSFENVCLEEDAVFTDESVANSGALNSWQWDLGDSNTDNGPGPIAHGYETAGDYDVTLIAGTDVGCSDTITQTITIHPMPVANFASDSVCFGLPTSFQDMSTVSTGSITSTTYEFGGGQGSEIADPTYAFPNTGYTDVMLTVATAFGCSDDTTKPIRVYVLPEPEFIFFDTCAGKDIFFTNMSSISEGAISTYAWNMGDVNTYNTISPTHSYATYGFYTAQLVATSNYGCKDTVSHEVEVFALPEPSFVVEPVEGCMPLPVEFLNTTTIAGGYSLRDYEWHFGNGNTAEVSNPTLVYDTAGAYNVTLIATSAKGCVDSLTVVDAVTVWPKPVADFRTDTLRYHMRFPKPRITDWSSGATEWHWDFGDNMQYTEQVPEHAYEEAGVYNIIQTVFNDFGCSDTFGIRVIVDPNITFFIPNTFTPNADDRNDTFHGEGEGILDAEMWIMNRWGQQLFYSKNIERRWDGTFNDNPVPTGMYLYKMIIVDINNRTKVYSGEVHLIR